MSDSTHEENTESNAQDAGAANMTPAVRLATQDDYAAAAHLFQFSMGDTFTLDRDLWEDVCQNEGYRVLVAEVKNSGVVGVAVLVVNDRIRLSAGTRRRRFHLDQLIVDPAERQKGYAHALLEAAKSLAAKEAPSYIIVNCDFTNVAARRTYEGADLHLVRQSNDRFEIAFDKQ